MLRFVQRTSCNLHKTLIVLEIVPAGSFGNVGPDAVGSAHDLLADRISGKQIPSQHDIPNLIGKILGQFVNPQTFKICLAHNPLATDYQLLTTDYQLLSAHY
jgi:hypothetical protein